jgi:hypothetical protein
MGAKVERGKYLEVITQVNHPELRGVAWKFYKIRIIILFSGAKKEASSASVDNRSSNGRNRSYDLGHPSFGRLPRWCTQAQSGRPVLEGIKGIRGIWLLAAMPTARQQPHGRASR